MSSQKRVYFKSLQANMNVKFFKKILYSALMN